MSAQYPLDLSPNPVYSFENFFVGESNRIALKSIKAFPDWPAPVFILFGPEGSGKTHLGEAWQSAHEGVSFIDDASRLNEDDLFSMTNRALNGELPGLLLADRLHPDHWRVNLPDLRSRLDYIPKLQVDEPDNEVLESVVRKLFEDRGRAVRGDIVKHMIGRYERTVPALMNLVSELDVAASREKRDLTLKFVSAFLKRAGG